MEGSPAYRNDTGAGLEAYRPCKVERFKCKTPLRGMCLVQARSRRVRRLECLNTVRDVGVGGWCGIETCRPT